MSEGNLSEADIRAIWHDDPVTMSRETLRQVAHYVTRPPVSWDPESFHRQVRDEPDEVLGAIDAMTARLRAYAAEREKAAFRLNPALRPELTRGEINQLHISGQGKYLFHGLTPRQDDLETIVGRLAFGSAVLEVEGVGYYADRYLKRQKTDGGIYPEITAANTPLSDHVGTAFAHCVVTCLADSAPPPDIQADLAVLERPEPELQRNVRPISLLDAMHLRMGAQERLRLEKDVDCLREENGRLSAVSDTWVILMFQRLCAEGVIPADGVPGRDFVLLNEAEHARDITPLLDALRADERATLLEERDSSGNLTQAWFLPAEDAKRIRETEERREELGGGDHMFIDDEGILLFRADVTDENLDQYCYSPGCACQPCTDLFAEWSFESNVLARQKQASVALLEPNGEGTCVALDALQFFLRPEQNQAVMHLVAADKDLGDQQEWVSKMVGLLTENYFRLNYTTPGDASPRGIKDAGTMLSYELATSLVQALDSVRNEVEGDFFTAQVTYARGPSRRAQAEARRRQTLDLAKGVSYPKGGPPSRAATETATTPGGSTSPETTRPTALGGRADRNRRRQPKGGAN